MGRGGLGLCSTEKNYGLLPFRCVQDMEMPQKGSPQLWLRTEDHQKDSSAKERSGKPKSIRQGDISAEERETGIQDIPSFVHSSSTYNAPNTITSTGEKGTNKTD